MERFLITLIFVVLMFIPTYGTDTVVEYNVAEERIPCPYYGLGKYQRLKVL